MRALIEVAPERHRIVARVERTSQSRKVDHTDEMQIIMGARPSSIGRGNFQCWGTHNASFFKHAVGENQVKAAARPRTATESKDTKLHEDAVCPGAPIGQPREPAARKMSPEIPEVAAENQGREILADKARSGFSTRFVRGHDA